MKKFYEEDLEDLIWEQMQTKEGRHKLRIRGLHIVERALYKRQPKLSVYGVPDIVVVSANRLPTTKEHLSKEKSVYHQGFKPLIQIIELKTVPINNDHIQQVLRYKTAMLEYYSKVVDLYHNSRDSDINIYDPVIECVLIGPSFDSDKSCFIYNELTELEIMTFDFDFSYGLTFKTVSKDWIRPNFNLDNTSINPNEIVGCIHTEVEHIFHHYNIRKNGEPSRDLDTDRPLENN